MRVFLVALCFMLGACKKGLDVTSPEVLLTDDKVFKNDTSTLDVITGMYSGLINGGMPDGKNSVGVVMGLAADELKDYYPDAVLSGAYTNNFSKANYYFWSQLYSWLYDCNAVIGSVPASVLSGAAELRRQAVGEALFVRAFLMWYATELYGDVPLALTTDHAGNNTLRRSPQASVYDQIVADLREARGLLGMGWLDGRGRVVDNRERPNRVAAMALLARVYLYREEWALAAAQADSVIGDGTGTGGGGAVVLEDSLNRVFLKGSAEAIWQMEPGGAVGSNTMDARFFVDATGSGPAVGTPVAMSDELAGAFEVGDGRRRNWVGQSVTSFGTYYYPYKYKDQGTAVATEYFMMLRLAEVYLVRAEARARLGDLAGASADVNRLRERAGLAGVGASSLGQMLSAIAHERRVELFTEWGDRWFDLKRTDSLDAVMGVVTPAKGGVWTSTDALLPIPQQEINLNPNLSQNPGY